MTLLHPGFMVAGIVAASAVVALHLIMLRLPPPTRFPTARFVPPGTARAIRRALRPDDIALLLLRMAVLLLLGAALSRPMESPDRTPVAKVIAVDVSRAVASIGEIRDSTESLLTAGDLLIAFDSTARPVGLARDSLAQLKRSSARGSLSAALVAAAHASAKLREQADSVEIVIITAAALEELDAATHAVRSSWPGRIRIVRVAGAALEARPDPTEQRVIAERDDPVAATIALWRWNGHRHRVRLVRGTPTPDDSAWAADGGVLVHWPARAVIEQSAGDSIGAVIAGNALVVAGFSRAAYGEAGSFGTDARPVAWWVDGRPAAAERIVGTGCIRDVAIDVPRRGDLVLRPSFQHLVRSLTAACYPAHDTSRIGEADLARLAGTGALARGNALPAGPRNSVLAPWLLLAALGLSLLEIIARRRRTNS